MNLSINVRADAKLEKFLKGLPRGVARVALPAFAQYLIGNGRRGLKHYQKYRYITRKRAYGKTFKSDRQRRKVMAMIRSGEILPGFPRRTGRTQRGYMMRISNNGYTVRIINAERGAVYTRHDKRQARLNALAGWNKAAVVIENNKAGAMRAAQTKVNQYLKKR